jgi:hypothetical protein
MDIRFGTWNVRSVYRARSLKTVGSESAKYNLDLVAVQEIGWFVGGSKPADDCTFFYGDGNDNHHLGTAFRTIMKSYHQLRGKNLLVVIGCHI